VRVWDKRIVVLGGDVVSFVFCFDSWDLGLLLSCKVHWYKDWDVMSNQAMVGVRVLFICFHFLYNFWAEIILLVMYCF
jgi:hypothetical protein